ncbi:transposase family protein [Streptomyces sp. S465]|uniref:transposase family protein n=1 Tax=Streptomyces sp. S465 TaxID=2979468 RepID=UPI0022A81129|nr:transposase family protein [Streptomyces sp. S465]WAP56558.1 hypothetical protein N6H00_17185 [Streptomyces sp. S465]
MRAEVEGETAGEVHYRASAALDAGRGAVHRGALDRAGGAGASGDGRVGGPVAAGLGDGRCRCAGLHDEDGRSTILISLDNDVLDPVIVTGCHAGRTHKLTSGQKNANRVIAVGRAPVEHGFAHLKNWRVLTKLRTDPARATCLLRALLVLTNLEVHR